MPRFIPVPVVPLIQNDAITRFQNRQLFTAGGTFNVPAGVSRVWVSMWGGGGGGGRAVASTPNLAQGGFGGSGWWRTLVPVTPGGTVTVTIGAAGLAGTIPNESGTAGGTTSFGSLLSAPGGAGGAPNIYANWSSPTPQDHRWLTEAAEGAGLPLEGLHARGQNPIGNSGGAGAFGSLYGSGGRGSAAIGFDQLATNGTAGALVVEW